MANQGWKNSYKFLKIPNSSLLLIIKLALISRSFDDFSLTIAFISGVNFRLVILMLMKDDFNHLFDSLIQVNWKIRF